MRGDVIWGMKDGTRRRLGSFAHNNRSLVTRGDEHAYLISTAVGSGIHNNSFGPALCQIRARVIKQDNRGA